MSKDGHIHACAGAMHIARALHQAAARVIYLDHTPDARAAA